MTEPKQTYADERELLAAFSEDVRESLKWNKALKEHASETSEKDALVRHQLFLGNLRTVQRGLATALKALKACDPALAYYYNYAFDPETAKCIKNALTETKCRIAAVETPAVSKRRGAPRKLPEYARKYEAELIERFGYTATRAKKMVREAFNKESRRNRLTVTA